LDSFEHILQKSEVRLRIFSKGVELNLFFAKMRSKIVRFGVCWAFREEQNYAFLANTQSEE
jgi:hypothetical protein